MIERDSVQECAKCECGSAVTQCVWTVSCGLNTDRAFVIKSFELPKKLCFVLSLRLETL